MYAKFIAENYRRGSMRIPAQSILDFPRALEQVGSPVSVNPDSDSKSQQSIFEEILNVTVKEECV